MKSLKDYLAESEQWMTTPVAGDVFAFELPDEVLCETYIIEVAGDCILLDSTPEINAALAEWATLEDTDEGDSGVIMETMGYGTLVGEGSMKKEMHKSAERMSLAQFKDRYGDEDWIEDFWRVSNGEPERGNAPIAPAKSGGWSPERMIAAKSKGVWTGSVDEDQDAAVVAGKEAAIDAAQRLATDEAKYQGREVQLNKKMPGDQAKFKVYVKDPATGNVKKVNFGHGGKTAKRLGQKTMRIRKSNPAARKSFRARHNCDNPGSKLKARYWSCKNW
jgi:hypothetical protein